MQSDTTFDEQALATVRRAYAKQILALAGVQSSPHLEQAFATVPREAFLGLPPWRVVAPFGGYHVLPSAEPVLAYQDVRFALAPERGVNNGQPSLHARWLNHAGLFQGDRVAHIGAGTGYYTALMAYLVGARGHVLAVEFDPTLAELATKNLSHLPNVTVVQGDGATWPRQEVDCVYVSFSVEQPADAWIERLKPGGRLVFPLGVPRPNRSPSGGVHALHGAGLLVVRGTMGFLARWLGPAFFVCAEGTLAGTTDQSTALAAAFERGGVEFVRSLRWQQPPTNRCWFVGSGWSLSYDEAS